VRDWADITIRSLLVSGSATILAALIGIPAGAWLGLMGRGVRLWVRPVVFSLMAMPPVVMGLALYLLLSHSGPLGRLEWLYSVRAMILAQTLLALPFVIGVTMQGIAAVPGELAQQLRSLGANAAQVRWAILREAYPAMGLAVAAALGRSLSEVGAVLMVGGSIAGSTDVLTTAIYQETRSGNFGIALALGAILLVLAWSANLAVAVWQREPAT
jgi:tungstate transport system permease protein